MDPGMEYGRNARNIMAREGMREDELRTALEQEVGEDMAHEVMNYLHERVEFDSDVVKTLIRVLVRAITPDVEEQKDLLWEVLEEAAAK